jgi:hypothetical protein
MDQQELAFVPDLLVVPVNSTVQFPNSDAVSHQVYSFSSVRQFQLPLYRGRAHPPVTFAKPGIVTLGCNIHDNMLAYIVVTAAQRYGRTTTSGEWQGSNVAAGRYRVRVWHPLLDETQELERMVEVGSEGDAVALTLTLTRKLKPAPLGRQPHSWAY